MSGLYATFMLAGHHLGVDVLEVQEVLSAQALTPVPLARATVEGLINLRGQIVPALNLRRLLLMPPRPPETPAVSVVVRTENGAVSLQVDEIGDVVELDAAAFEPPPRNLDDRLKRVIRGIYKLDRQLLLVLDTGRTVMAEAE